MRNTIYGLLAMLLFICLPSAASSAAHRSDLYPQGDANAYLIDQLLNGDKTINLCLDMQDKLTPGETKEIDDLVAQVLPQAVKDWLLGTAGFIRAAGREREFADLLQILEYDYQYNYGLCPGPTVPIRTGKIPFTLRFMAAHQTQYMGAGAIFQQYENGVPLIVFPPLRLLEGRHEEINLPPLMRGLLGTIKHEMGHVFGLADQYTTYVQGYDHRSHIYGTVEVRPSIMDSETDLTCDDADGIITLFDRFGRNTRAFDSLCNDGVRFINGRQQIAGPTEKQSLDTPIPDKRGRINAARAVLLDPAQMARGEYQAFTAKTAPFGKLPQFDFVYNSPLYEKTKKRFDENHKVTLYQRQIMRETPAGRDMWPLEEELIFDFGGGYRIYVTTPIHEPEEVKKLRRAEFLGEMRNYPQALQNIKRRAKTGPLKSDL